MLFGECTNEELNVQVLPYLPKRLKLLPLIISMYFPVNYRGSLGFGQSSLLSLPKNIGTQDVRDVQVGLMDNDGYIDESDRQTAEFCRQRSRFTV